MWIIIITVLALIGSILIIRSAMKDAKDYQETISKIKEEEMYIENDIDEFSPENMISDETIKRVVLRNKLQKIENEKETKEFGDFDHTRIDGR